MYALVLDCMLRPLTIRLSNGVLTHNVMVFGSENFGRQLGLDAISVLVSRGGQIEGPFCHSVKTQPAGGRLPARRRALPGDWVSLHLWAFSASTALGNKSSNIFPFSPCPRRQHQYLFLSSRVSSWDCCNHSPRALPHPVWPLRIHSP